MFFIHNFILNSTAQVNFSDPLENAIWSNPTLLI